MPGLAVSQATVCGAKSVVVVEVSARDPWFPSGQSDQRTAPGDTRFRHRPGVRLIGAVAGKQTATGNQNTTLLFLLFSPQCYETSCLANTTKIY